MVTINKIDRIGFWLSVLAILIGISYFICGCGAPKMINPIQMPQLSVEKEEIIIDRDKIEKPDKPIPVLLNKNFIMADSTNDIIYFAFNIEEFSKIIQLSKAFDSQKEIISLGEDEINKRILKNNVLVDLIYNKNSVAQDYANLYIKEKNLRKQEMYQCEKENKYKKFLLYLETGVIIILSFMK